MVSQTRIIMGGQVIIGSKNISFIVHKVGILHLKHFINTHEVLSLHVGHLSYSRLFFRLLLQLIHESI